MNRLGMDAWLDADSGLNSENDLGNHAFVRESDLG